MARIGIGLMGHWPSAETRRAWEGRISLRPVLSWRTLVAETKLLPAGASLGYDLTERLARDSKIGICPVGYWHGYPLALSGKGQVLVRGRKVRVLGRVSMDMLVVDLTDAVGAKAGDVVTLIGSDRGETVDADADGPPGRDDRLRAPHPPQSPPPEDPRPLTGQIDFPGAVLLINRKCTSGSSVKSSGRRTTAT